MADTVDGLVIEIESTSNGTAGAQLEALARNLETLKKAVSGSTPLKTFSKNYQELINTINTSQVDVTRLEGLRAVSQVVRSFENVKTGNSQVRSFAKNYVELANSINSTDINTVKLEGLRAFGQVTTGFNSIKISPSIARQLNNLYTVMESMSVQGTENLLKMSTSLSSLNGVKISPSVGNQLERIAKFAQSIEGQNYTSLNSLIDALNRIQFVGASSAENLRTVSTSLKQTASAARTATSSTKKFNTVLANIRVRTLALVRVTQMITRATTKALSVYGDYVETLNLFKMAMGEAGSEAYEFAEKCQELLGIDLTQWMKAQGVFNSLAVGFGIASDKAAVMSQNLTQLAYDISSFYNIDVDSAIEKVRSGFSGQIRPVRDLGYDLSQVKLEAIAVSLGIDKSVKSMTQAEKSQLRYIALMTQLTHVQGDLSRTLNSPINQMRILQAQLEQMYRAIGLTLLPILNKVLPYLNAILRVIKMIAMEIAEMFGIVLPTLSGETVTSNLGVDVEDLTDDLEDATGAAEKLKNTLASFDQINLITSSSGGSGGSGSTATVGGDLDIDLPTYDFLGDAAENKAQEIAEKMMRALRDPIDFIEKTIKYVADNIEGIGEALAILATVTIGKKLIGSVMSAWQWFKDLSDVAKGIGFITIGLQLSWLGGKDIAQGNFFDGFIKSTIGSLALGYGMSFALGPLGWVLGIATGVVMTFEGYKAEKLEQLKKDINDSFMELLPNQTKITELNDAWKNFVDQFYTPEIDEKNSVASALKTDVDEIGTAIMQLYTNYNNGTITGAAYATNLEQMYGDMEISIKKHLEAVGQAINEYLDGPFGRWLQMNGEDVQATKENVAKAIEEIGESLDDNRLKLEELNRQYESGEKSEEAYKRESKELIDSLSNMYELLGLNTDATNTFLESFENIDVNFEDWDTLQTKLAEIKKGYEDAEESIDGNTESLQSYFATLRDNAKTDEMRKYWQGLIEEAGKFGEEQKTVLRNNYQDILESIENSGAISWSKVYDEKGFADTYMVLSGNMKNLEGTISDMYSGAKIERNKTYWTELMKIMGEYSDYADALGEREKNGELNKAQKQRIMGYLEDFQKFSDKIRRNSDEVPEVFKKTWDKMESAAKNGLTKVNQAEKTYATESNHTVSAWGYNYDVITKRTYDDVLRTVDTFKVRQKSSMQNAMSAVQQVISTSNAPEEMKRIMAKMNDAIKPDEFGQKGTSLKEKFLSGFKKDFTPVTTINDFKETMGRMLSGEDAKKWGEQIGVGVKFGISDGLSGTEQGVQNALQGAKTVLNNFGYASAQYWAQMSANIIAVMSALMKNPTSTANASLQAILKGMTWNMKGFAQGGFPDSADFFYANENGVPEYVGSMGGRTAVANNNDIVKGISNGVVRAITSTGIQNDVRKLASKSNTVVFAPSAEAGRVMTQSVNLYNQTGGRR